MALQKPYAWTLIGPAWVRPTPVFGSVGVGTTCEPITDLVWVRPTPIIGSAEIRLMLETSIPSCASSQMLILSQSSTSESLWNEHRVGFPTIRVLLQKDGTKNAGLEKKRQRRMNSILFSPASVLPSSFQTDSVPQKGVEVGWGTSMLSLE